MDYVKTHAPYDDQTPEEDAFENIAPDEGTAPGLNMEIKTPKPRPGIIRVYAASPSPTWPLSLRTDGGRNRL